MSIVHNTRCDICKAESDEPVGQPCKAESCKYGSVIRAIELDRRLVEIADKGSDDYQAAGFVGDALSREFGVRVYKTFAGAERSAVRWLEKHAETAAAA